MGIEWGDSDGQTDMASLICVQCVRIVQGTLTASLLGPLERANLVHWTLVIQNDVHVH
jgi:hypothetical protein